MMPREISKQFLHSSQLWPWSVPEKSLTSTRVALCRAPDENKRNMGKGGMSAHYQHWLNPVKKAMMGRARHIMQSKSMALEDSPQADGTAENLATNKHSEGQSSNLVSVPTTDPPLCCLFALGPSEQELVLVQPLHNSALTVAALHTSLQQ